MTSELKALPSSSQPDFYMLNIQKFIVLYYIHVKQLFLLKNCLK